MCLPTVDIVVSVFEEIKAVLQDIAFVRKDIFGFNAEKTLKVWKKQGYLDFCILRK